MNNNAYYKNYNFINFNEKFHSNCLKIKSMPVFVCFCNVYSLLVSLLRFLVRVCLPYDSAFAKVISECLLPFVFKMYEIPHCHHSTATNIASGLK